MTGTNSTSNSVWEKRLCNAIGSCTQLNNFTNDEWVCFLNKVREQARFKVVTVKGQDPKPDFADIIGYAEYASKMAMGFYQYCFKIKGETEYLKIAQQLK